MGGDIFFPLFFLFSHFSNKRVWVFFFFFQNLLLKLQMLMEKFVAIIFGATSLPVLHVFYQIYTTLTTNSTSCITGYFLKYNSQFMKHLL